MTKGADRTTIVNEAGVRAEAVAPVIVSASRSTDIPAFYADWFFDRLEKGYSAWINPFCGTRSYVSYDKTRFIVFWSKNPLPLIPYLCRLKDKGIGCYIQYTLNDYEAEGLERGVPALGSRIDTFKRLVDVLGKGAVVWRFDPLVLTDSMGPYQLMEKLNGIARRLEGYTEKLVFSYADITQYRKVRYNLERNDIKYREWTEAKMLEMAQLIAVANSSDWKLNLATCGERINLEKFGIEHNQCVDDALIARLCYDDKILMDYLGMNVCRVEHTLFDGNAIPVGAIDIGNGMYALRTQNNHDKGQREFCGCVRSKDIGAYNTCPHLCEYCYANSSSNSALANWSRYKSNPGSESII